MIVIQVNPSVWIFHTDDGVVEMTAIYGELEHKFQTVCWTSRNRILILEQKRNTANLARLLFRVYEWMWVNEWLTDHTMSERTERNSWLWGKPTLCAQSNDVEVGIGKWESESEIIHWFWMVLLNVKIFYISLDCFVVNKYCCSRFSQDILVFYKLLFIGLRYDYCILTFYVTETNDDAEIPEFSKRWRCATEKTHCALLWQPNGMNW